jgi:hypothetical protein
MNLESHHLNYGGRLVPQDFINATLVLIMSEARKINNTRQCMTSALERSIFALSRVLQYSSENSRYIPIKEELSVITDYALLQEKRFGCMISIMYPQAMLLDDSMIKKGAIFHELYSTIDNLLNASIESISIEINVCGASKISVKIHDNNHPPKYANIATFHYRKPRCIRQPSVA